MDKLIDQNMMFFGREHKNKCTGSAETEEELEHPEGAQHTSVSILLFNRNQWMNTKCEQFV